jgi:REP element-mobilizing transposase RayT
MGLPRSDYVREGKVGVYHCTTRCVRRAFLAGFDSHTGRDFSHRKQWIEDRLQFLASIFSVEVTTFSVMSNHYHVTLRIRPDIAETWSDREVASRWLTLCPKRYRSKKKATEPIEEQIRNLALCTERIAEFRKRLGSLSWFMRFINEYIARAANKEDEVKGRFWESRFKCQALLDYAAIAAGMVYIDLNPIRARIAQTPEDSDFTGIQQRIRIWKQKTSSGDRESLHRNWLCPISSDGGYPGILPMSEEEYFTLVDKSGRLLHSNKRGAIDADLAPILERIGAKPEVWSETISCFEDKFRLAAGMVNSLRKFADQLGKRWFAGLSASRSVFVTSKS